MKTIDLTPTWTQILPAILVLLKSGTKDGKQVAIEELQKMAKAADLYNAED